MSEVSSNDAVAYSYLAELFDGFHHSIGREGEIFDRDVTTIACSIAINGTKGEVSLCNGGLANETLDEDAAAAREGRIARDSAVGQDERAPPDADAAAVGGGII